MPAYGNLTFTTNAFYILKPALARVRADSLEFLGIGDSTYTYNHEAAKILNEIERNIYQRHPKLGISSTTISVTAGTRTATLPANVWGIQIEGVYYYDSGRSMNTYAIREVSRDEYEFRDETELADTDAVDGVPSGYCLDKSGSNILFMELLPSTTTFTVTYRAAPTTYASTDLTSGSTKYSAIPNEHIDCMINAVAARFAAMMGDMEKAKYWSDLQAEAELSLDKAVKRSLSASRSETFDMVGYARPLHQTGTYANIGFVRQR